MVFRRDSYYSTENSLLETIEQLTQTPNCVCECERGIEWERETDERYRALLFITCGSQLMIIEWGNKSLCARMLHSIACISFFLYQAACYRHCCSSVVLFFSFVCVLLCFFLWTLSRTKYLLLDKYPELWLTFKMQIVFMPPPPLCFVKLMWF